MWHQRGMLTPTASTFTLLFELFSLKVKYLIFFFFEQFWIPLVTLVCSSVRARRTVNVKGFCHSSQLMQREILHCWGSTSVFKHYANLDPFVVQIKVDLPPPLPLHHNALSGTDVTSILYSSNNINGDGWQDRYLCHSTSLTNIWQIVSDSQTVPQISHTTDSCGSNCATHSLNQSNLIRMVRGCKIALSQRTRESSCWLKFKSHFWVTQGSWGSWVTQEKLVVAETRPWTSS